jgi:hypothetical protein
VLSEMKRVVRWFTANNANGDCQKFYENRRSKYETTAVLRSAFCSKLTQ